MRHLLKLSGVVLFVFLVSACKKDTTDNFSETERLLTSHGWRYDHALVRSQLDYSFPWWRDDCWVFNPDGTYYYSVGEWVTLAGEKDSYGTWKLSSDGKIIYRIGTSSFSTFTDYIYSVTHSELILMIEQYDKKNYKLYVYLPCELKKNTP